MINWIYGNKEWIFSGIGVVIIAAFAGWVYRCIWGRSKRQGDQQSEETAKSIPTPTTETHWDRLIYSKQQEPSSRLRDYYILHTPTCLEDLNRLHLTQEDLVTLIQSEFRSHLNYFRFDLEDYMMPVKASYVVYMDKVGNSLTFKRVFPCTKNEAKLSSWNDILAIYRRATRLAYRDDPNVLFTRRGQFGAAARMHLDIEMRISKHFQEYEDLRVLPPVVDNPELALISSPKDKIGKDDRQRLAVSVAFHLSQAHSACREGYDFVKDLDQDLRTPDSAVGDLVACLERSLQHLHKILILFPPTEDTLVQFESDEGQTP